MLAVVANHVQAADTRLPNIVYIYADDLGYGDIGCYGANGIKTPNLDRLATQGLRFTDAHSPSATCTPSRYALLTGEYAWRKPGTGILPGDAALIIEPGRPTLPSLLKQAGYTTGCVGKWHLGLGKGNLDWNGEIKPGPLEVGFDSCFIMPATGDRVPCVYVKDHRVVGLDPKDPIQVNYTMPIGDDPTGKDHPELLKVKPSHGHDSTIINGVSRIGFMTGGHSARWVDQTMAETFNRKANEFIEANQDRPFFLYYATHDIHVPRLPGARFLGKSERGVRGDVIEELDWCVGDVLATLDRLKLTNNTLFIFTSDNGPVVDDGYADGAVEALGEHKPSGPLRGGKYSPYEGGTRVPFLVRWPGKIKPGDSSALLCQIDLLATFAALVKQDVPAGAGPDSMNLLPALLGESDQGRDHLVEHANVLSIRKGSWKLVSGVPGRELPKKVAAKKKAARRPAELFDLSKHLDESENVAAEHPDVVKDLTDLLDQVRQRSPGSASR
ncbi:MAG: arylsulfatase [Isosphaeraceae bacterium]